MTKYIINFHFKLFSHLNIIVYKNAVGYYIKLKLFVINTTKKVNLLHSRYVLNISEG